MPADGGEEVQLNPPPAGIKAPPDNRPLDPIS